MPSHRGKGKVRKERSIAEGSVQCTRCAIHSPQNRKRINQRKESEAKSYPKRIKAHSTGEEALAKEKEEGKGYWPALQPLNVPILQPHA